MPPTSCVGLAAFKPSSVRPEDELPVLLASPSPSPSMASAPTPRRDGTCRDLVGQQMLPVGDRYETEEEEDNERFCSFCCPFEKMDGRVDVVLLGEHEGHDALRKCRLKHTQNKEHDIIDKRRDRKCQKRSDGSGDMTDTEPCSFHSHPVKSDSRTAGGNAEDGTEEHKKRSSNLNDCHVEEGPPQPDGDRRSGHHRRPGQEPYGHRERRRRVPARYYPRLQRHEQPCQFQKH
ncbi:hypothetical protein BHM03_00028901 [Ensete ventricosum]|nr:hypothetical protein BHM03_00028901 [Ensete ventricosum]